MSVSVGNYMYLQAVLTAVTAAVAGILYLR